MRGIGLAIAAAALLGTVAFAQGENGFHPNLSARAANFIDNLVVSDRRDKMQRKACDRTGCLFLVNRSTDYDIVELRFDTLPPGGTATPVWSNNALRQPVQPAHSVGLMKFGDKTLCGLPVRLVLEDRRDRSRSEVTGTMNLCTAPGVDVFSIGSPQK